METPLKTSLCLCLLMVLGSGTASYCQQQSASAGEKTNSSFSEDVKSIIDQKNAQLEEWYKAGQIDSAATYFASDVVQMPPFQQPVVGREKYKEYWREMMRFGQWEFDLQAQEVRQRGDMAVELGKYTLSFTPNQDSPMPALSDRGNYVVLWEKKDGDWKIVWDAPVSEVPMPSAMNGGKTD